MFEIIQSDINQYLAKPTSKELKAIVEEDIKYLYKEEFNESIEKILIDNESVYMSSFKSKALEVLKGLLPSNVWEEESFQDITKTAENETYEALYKPVLAEIQKGFTEYESSQKGKFLSLFEPHCKANLDPNHNCPNKGVFIPIKANDKVKYVVCNECKMIYYANMILMHCDSCAVPFYSCYLSPIDKIMPPATWEMYHCDILRNEQMKCIKCGDLFWLKGEDLHCRNCKFLINPLEVAWRCVKCNKEFRARAKAYNALENQIIKASTKRALINKVIVVPREMPCECFKKVMEANYAHNDRCDGRMYLSEVMGMQILVCSKCCIFSSLNKFEWNCPSCKKGFYSTDIVQVIQGGSTNTKPQRNSAINLGKSEEKLEDEQIEMKNDSQQETPKKYTILYGNETQGYQENRFMIRPEKEELLDKAQVLKQIKSQHSPKEDNGVVDIKTKTIENNVLVAPPGEFINFTMNELTIISKENNILSHVKDSNQDYSLLLIPISEEIRQILTKYQPMNNLIQIYGYIEEDNVFKILIEKIDSTLNKEIVIRNAKDKKPAFTDSEMVKMLTQCIQLLQLYSFITPDRLILSQTQPTKWKYSPFQTEEHPKEYASTYKAAPQLALMLIHAVSLNEKEVSKSLDLITKQKDEELTEYIMSSFKEKHSSFFCELLCKLLNSKSPMTLNQLEQIYLG